LCLCAGLQSNGAHHPPQVTSASQPSNSRRSVCMGVVSLRLLASRYS
jgi:hypothetical protein